MKKKGRREEEEREGIVGEKGKEGWRGREVLKLKILGDKNIH